MIAVLATLKVTPGQETGFEAVAQELAQNVQAHEPGCRLYLPCRGKQAGEYAFIERYDDEAALAAHRQTEHYKRLGRQMGAFLDGAPVIAVFTEL